MLISTINEQNSVYPMAVFAPQLPFVCKRFNERDLQTEKMFRIFFKMPR